MTKELVATTNPLVVQHNAMINAGFAMSALEMRCFLVMISRISREDTALPVCRIPVRELCADSNSKNVYTEVRAMTEKLASRFLLLEVLGPNGERQKEPDIKNRPLMGAIDYLKREGVVEAVFNEHLKPYLIELKNNFTKAQLSQVLKIKRPTSHRIYWLLREYVAFGKRTISVNELRHILGLKDEYIDRFDHFRARVLDPAQEELAQTDLPFTYELIKQGRVITEIRFLFPSTSAALPEILPPSDPWAESLLAAGVANKSLETVREKLAAGAYDEGYVYFVLQTVRTQVDAGKVKKPAGAIFKALVDGYLLPAYQKTQLTPVTPTKPKARTNQALSSQRRRLQSELEDAHNSLEFFQTSLLYTDDTRPALVAQVKSKITELEQQMQLLGA
ncbi:MAG: RepB family plasmid replication initiator protein [Hymenobacter sp.]|nr:MAG: RepB family plasmid replication initiator protein [Hymenobacter sp.]